MKTLKITDELHRKIKVFCAENDLKINEWVEKELENILTSNEPKQTPTTQRPPVSQPPPDRLIKEGQQPIKPKGVI